MIVHNFSWYYFKKILIKIDVKIDIFISLALFIFFIFFHFVVSIFKLSDLGYSSIAIIMCLLVAYELFFIRYILICGAENALKNIEIVAGRMQTPYEIFENMAKHSTLFYLIILAVLSMFLITDLIEFVFGQKYFFASWDEMNHWGFWLDVYNYFLNYFINFLLAIIIWIIIRLSITMDNISTYEYSSSIKTELLSYDNMGSLRSLIKLIYKVFTYYFICISLAIMSYFSPVSYVYYQSILYILLLLIGLALFLKNLVYIKRILINLKIKQIKLINEVCSEQFDKFLYEDLNEDELCQSLSKLAIAESFYELLMRKKGSSFDLGIIATILSIFVSIITLVQRFFI